jgi:ElaB/YqjD/DUF883 family membrane-anchored ribosome-binding protein
MYHNNEELSMKTLDKVSNSAHDAYDKIASTGSQVIGLLDEKGGQLKNTEQQLVKNCRSYIGENPMASVGIAAAVGFLLSRLLKQR